MFLFATTDVFEGTRQEVHGVVCIMWLITGTWCGLQTQDNMHILFPEKEYLFAQVLGFQRWRIEISLLVKFYSRSVLKLFIVHCCKICSVSNISPL